MDIAKRLEMSFYKTIATINEEHKVYVAQNTKDQHIYIKKNLAVYNFDVYNYLLHNPIPGTPYIYDLYQEDNTLTVIEEYVSGYTLQELLERNRRFSLDEIKNIAYQLCCIVERLHTSNPTIIHRDIKPSNIILRNDGTVVLLDLNAAKHVSLNKQEDTILLGTKGYAAPEQYGFGTSNEQTDIYAIGMVINTLLYGEFYPSPYPNCELTPIILKCIQMDPKDRFKSVSVLKLQFQTKEQINQTSNDTGIRRYFPPGFRTLKPLNMLLASCYYPFIFWLCLSLEVKNASSRDIIIERIFCLLIFLGISLISANYLGIHKRIPLCRRQNIGMRILGVILFDFLYAFALMIIMTILVLAVH